MSRIDPVGDDAERAQRLVHVRLHLAPERAEAGMLAVEVVHDHDRGLRRAGDIVEIVEPLLHVAGFAERHLVLGLEGHGLGEADDRRQVRERAVQMLDGVAVAAPLGRDDLDQVANRRRIDRAQEFELARGHSRHGRFLRGSSVRSSWHWRIGIRVRRKVRSSLRSAAVAGTAVRSPPSRIRCRSAGRNGDWRAGSRRPGRARAGCCGRGRPTAASLSTWRRQSQLASRGVQA